MRRVSVIASASGCGKTTVGRSIAERLGAPVDAFVASIAPRADG